MRIQILNKRLLYISRPGISLFNPSEYTEQLLIPISKIARVRLVCNCLDIHLVNNDRIEFSPGNKEDSQKIFEALTGIFVDVNKFEPLK